MCAVKAWRRTWTTLNPPPSMASKGAGKTAVVQAAVVEVVVAAWEVYHAVVWVGSQRTKGTPSHTHTDTRTHTIHTDSSIFTIPTTHRSLHWKSFPKPQLERRHHQRHHTLKPYERSHLGTFSLWCASMTSRSATWTELGGTSGRERHQSSLRARA
jgi:hypothetical protein